MHWHLSIYSWIYLFTAAIVVGVAAAIGRRSKLPGTTTLIWLMVAAAQWSLMAFLDVTAVEKSSKIFWSSLEYLGEASSLTLLLIFVIEYTRHNEWLTRRNRTLLWLGSILIVGLVWTNPWHGLFWTDFTPGPVGTNILIYHHGPAFWAVVAYIYILVALAIFLVIRAAADGRGVYRRQLLWLLLSVVVPVVGSLMYLLGTVPVHGWDVTPISFSIVGVLLGWNIFRHRLLDLIPVARHKLVEQMLDGVVVLDSENRIVDINAAARQLLWPSPSSPIGQPARAAIATWPDLLARYRKVEKAEIETQVETSNGLRDLFLQISPLYDSKRHFIGRMIVLRDVTEQKRTVETLRQLSQAVEQSPASVMITDLQGNITYVNPKFTQLSGYTREEALGQNPRILKSGLTPQAEYQRLWETITGGGEWHGQFCNRRKNGELYWVATIIVPVIDDHGEITHYLAVKEDITERKRVEDALQQLNASLEQQVSERTLQLQERFRELEAEITERKRVEAALRATEESLVQRVADQSRKLAALYEVILVAGQSQEVQELLEQSLAKVMVVLGGEAACVHLWDESGMVLNLAAHAGLSNEAQEQIAEMPGNWLTEDNIPRTVSDLSIDKTVPAPICIPGFSAYLGARINLGGRAIGTLSVFWQQPAHFPVEDIALFSAMADQLGILMENVRLRQRSMQAAAMQERRRLARDLHDSVTQSLHSLVLQADIAGNRLQQGDLDRLRGTISQLAESARQSLKEMRLLLYELRLIPLDQVNLVEALNTRLEAVEARAGIKAEMVVEGETNWPQAWDGELYCIAMEALNNSLKHARATEVTVRLTSEANWVELEINDNGCGFNVHTPRIGGMGLITMAERAERLGGSIKVESTLNMGTKIQFRVDFDRGSAHGSDPGVSG